MADLEKNLNRINERLDISKKQAEVANLGQRLNSAMKERLISESEKDASETPPIEKTPLSQLGIPHGTPHSSELWLARTWGLKMRCLRYILDLTLDELAQAMKVSRNTISKYEDQENSARARAQIALAFDIFVENQPNSADVRQRIALLLASLGKNKDTI